MWYGKDLQGIIYRKPHDTVCIESESVIRETIRHSYYVHHTLSVLLHYRVCSNIYLQELLIVVEPEAGEVACRLGSDSQTTYHEIIY